MTPEPLRDPRFLPFKLDLVGQRALWVRLDAAQRRDAAFLDERALPPSPEGGWLSLDAWQHAAPVASAPAADAIFHIGHCGSTLLSRLLESWPEVEALREPLPLRSLAEVWDSRGDALSRISTDDAEALLDAAWAAWSRPLPPRSRSLVKATSGCNGLIDALLQRQPAMRVVLLDMPLRPWLATLFKSPDSMFDAASAAPSRLRYLQSRGLAEGLALHAMSLPVQCAVGWLAERLRFDALAAGPYGRRVLRVEFETLLDAPAPTLREIADHLGLAAERVAAAVTSPAWGRYAKAQAHEYGRDDRAHDLALSLQRHAVPIAEAEAWLARWQAAHPDVSFGGTGGG